MVSGDLTASSSQGPLSVSVPRTRSSDTVRMTFRVIFHPYVAPGGWRVCHCKCWWVKFGVHVAHGPWESLTYILKTDERFVLI